MQAERRDADAYTQPRLRARELQDDATSATKRARTGARVPGVKVIGTLGVALNARVTQHMDSAANVLHALRDARMRLDDATIAAVLARGLGEEWTA